MSESPTAPPRRPAPRWAHVLAWTVPALTLPSILFRLGVAAAGPVCDPVASVGQAYVADPGETLYILGLCAGSMMAALATLGLVQRWGEVVPSWVPLVGGRRVPVLAAVVPAALGATVMGALTLWQLAVMAFRIPNPWHNPSCVFPQDGFAATAITLAYLPLMAWPILLAILTVEYWRRRTGHAGG